MLIPAETLQFAGSLVAILILAWLVKRLGLGRNPTLADDDHAKTVAAEVHDGFVAESVARDEKGEGALLRDARGRTMVLKPHGVHFAGRILTSSASATLSGSSLQIMSGEKRFGDVYLTIEDAAYWAEAINRLHEAGNA
ncbi:hypothetical protein [Altererythrobacter lutimaris]|uniref:Uncharacterized protein n=1 Tax=Altererythrobacter lutimaris TaxID=2743979 RepID=A0A850H781_9SPHN|nr:hypothetical protein [Altererythrobacter lutimaris]NVE95124.1 hypothetical protein [Altererythrobacter lutimaris]